MKNGKRKTKYAIVAFGEDGTWLSYCCERDTLGEDIAIMDIINQREKEQRVQHGFIYGVYYKFVIKVPDSIWVPPYEEISNSRILYTPPYISFMKGWTIKKARDWIKNKYLKG